jgi:hybrid cluster-associated redox disulfide protein
MTVTRETLIIDMLRACPNLQALTALFNEIGMHCLGCHLSEDETVAEACEVHGVEVEQFLARVNAVMHFELTKDTAIGDILKYAPECEPIFYAYGMHCLGCEISAEETLEEACAAHLVDLDEMLEKMHEVILDFQIQD